MNVVGDLPDVDVLDAWAAARTQRVRLYGRVIEAGLRFAFYGRVSTEDYQDPVSSRRWQFDLATEVVAGRGRITAEFFDVGCSREITWSDRPEAARLLAAITDPDRGFDAIVVGEYARAFYGSQVIHLAPLLREYGVQLWLPELDGPVDLDSPTHQALLLMLGAQSKLEVQRARFRTTAAMQAQAREQGRHLGGRPPYGYRIADAGPHPNRAQAAWGRRLHRLEPDPQTAPWVKWIFARRLEGHSIAGIARMLNEMNVPCPSAVDRKRNPHRPVRRGGNARWQRSWPTRATPAAKSGTGNRPTATPRQAARPTYLMSVAGRPRADSSGGSRRWVSTRPSWALRSPGERSCPCRMVRES